MEKNGNHSNHNQNGDLNNANSPNCRWVFRGSICNFCPILTKLWTCWHTLARISRKCLWRNSGFFTQVGIRTHTERALTNRFSQSLCLVLPCTILCCSDRVPRKLALLHIHADWLGSSCHHDYYLGNHHRNEIQRVEVRIDGRQGDDPGA